MTDYDSDSYYFSAERAPSSQTHISILPNEALIEATASFDLRTVLKLLESGIDPNEPLEDGITALHIAANADRERVYIMQALLDYDADPNIQSLEGMTPLHVAATWGKIDSIKLLLANNADPRVRDLSGKTPLDCSNELRHKECTSYLREILQGRSIPRSVADVFDELDFESFHTQLLTQSEPVLDDYLSDFISAPRSRDSKGGRGKHSHKNKPKKTNRDTMADLDTSDEQFLTELNQVLGSDLVADRDLMEFEQKTIEQRQNTKTVKNPLKKKSQHDNGHKRTHSSPAVVTHPNTAVQPPRKPLDMPPVREYTQQTSEEEIDLQNHTFTKKELSVPNRNNLNDTFEVFREESSVLPLDGMNTGFSDDSRPESPSLANMDLADSDATLTLYGSDDSDFFKGRCSTLQSSRSKPAAKSSIYTKVDGTCDAAMKSAGRRANSVDVVSNFVKADELIARNHRNRVTFPYEQQTNMPEVVAKSERHEFAYNRPVDKPTETARMSDKLSDTPHNRFMLPTNPPETANSTYNRENTHKIDFASSQPYSYDVSPDIDDNTEVDGSPLDGEEGDENRRRMLNYSQRESYIQPPENKKKPIAKKIGEIVSKSKSITAKSKLSFSKPNFMKNKDNKQTTNKTQENIPGLDFQLSDVTSITPTAQQDQFLNMRMGYSPVSPSTFHTSETTVARACKASTGTQTFTDTPSPSSVRSAEHAKPNKQVNKTKTRTQATPPDIQAISAMLDRECMYNGSSSSVMYPQLSDCTEQTLVDDESHRDTPPYSTLPLTQSPAYTPDNPSPYQGKKTQDFPRSPHTNTDTPSKPNIFSNPYLDTTSNPYLDTTSTSPHTPLQSTYTPPQSTYTPPQSTYTPPPQSTYTPPLSTYTLPQSTSKTNSTIPQSYIQTEPSAVSNIPTPTTPHSHTATPQPIPTSSVSSPSPSSFSTLLEEVNRSLPYELKLNETPTPTTPMSPNTPTLPSSLKYAGQPTPFTQVGFSPEKPSPALSSKSLTPRSKRRVKIDPVPTDVQFCDEYDRTPVMPSLDPHFSDDSSDAREELQLHQLTSHPGAQAGGAYVPPPPYQGTSPTPVQPQVSEFLDTTFELDPSNWKESPDYIGLDEYLKQNSQELPPRPSQATSPSGAIPPQLTLLSDKQLREELIKIGEQPGPITPITRPLYVRYLSKVGQDPSLQASNCFQGYLYELAQVFMTTRPIPDEQEIETEMCHFFDNPPQNCTWREGITKESFNYILIDPRISQNLPSQIAELSELDRFRIFVESIFYIGKGKRSRTYSHLYEAMNCEKSDARPNSKHQRILDIWASGQGVVSLHCFQGIIAVEAFTREACLIEAIGIHKLTNAKKGEYYGVVSGWDGSRKRRLGVYLLHRAMHILIAEGERQICKENLTSKKY